MEKYEYKEPGQNVILSDKLKIIQNLAGIEETGKLDFETKKLFVIPRCGVTESAVHNQTVGSRRKKRYYLQGTRWQKKVRDLTVVEQVPAECRGIFFTFFASLA